MRLRWRCWRRHRQPEAPPAAAHLTRTAAPPPSAARSRGWPPPRGKEAQRRPRGRPACVRAPSARGDAGRAARACAGGYVCVRAAAARGTCFWAGRWGRSTGPRECRGVGSAHPRRGRRPPAARRHLDMPEHHQRARIRRRRRTRSSGRAPPRPTPLLPPTQQQPPPQEEEQQQRAALSGLRVCPSMLRLPRCARAAALLGAALLCGSVAQLAEGTSLGTASASSERAGHAAALAFDGSNTSYWSSRSPASGQWIALQLQKPARPCAKRPLVCDSYAARRRAARRLREPRARLLRPLRAGAGRPAAVQRHSLARRSHRADRYSNSVAAAGQQRRQELDHARPPLQRTGFQRGADAAVLPPSPSGRAAALSCPLCHQHECCFPRARRDARPAAAQTAATRWRTAGTACWWWRCRGAVRTRATLRSGR